MASPPNSNSNSTNIKTTVIISNLSRDDFVSNKHTSEHSSELAFVDRIKLSILNLPPPSDTLAHEFGEEYYLNSIQHWANLSSLSRVIIIFKTDEAAQNIYNYFQDNLSGNLHDLKFGSNVKIALQDNLLARSKSFDSLVGEGNAESNNLSVTSKLSKFKTFHNSGGKSTTTDYDEPEPQQFNVYEDLTKLGIDLSSYNNSQQLDDLKQGTNSPTPSSPTNEAFSMSPPSIDKSGSSTAAPSDSGVKRSKSLTKTLFKPDLKLNTKAAKYDPSGKPPPASPSITLDETF